MQTFIACLMLVGFALICTSALGALFLKDSYANHCWHLWREWTWWFKCGWIGGTIVLIGLGIGASL